MGVTFFVMLDTVDDAAATTAADSEAAAPGTSAASTAADSGAAAPGVSAASPAAATTAADSGAAAPALWSVGGNDSS